ncbi:MAG: tetratricopeptide repeat protein [Hormoscilla sp. GM7CHS1pb]|nr:tetratricopeptide repeat protein [Hormoscilla sp. GM7CHS1pb]
MSITHLLQLSQILASKNYFQSAQLKVEEAIALDPNSAIAYNYLGFVLAQSGKLAEAEAAVRSALRLKPDFAAAHNHLGVILGNQGKLAEAEASVRSALLLNPNDAQARRNLQVILKHNQDLTQKIPFSTGARSPKTMPPELNSAQDYNNFSLALLRERKFAAAEVAAREAIRLSPTDAQVHNTLGAILFKCGKTAEASS